MKQGYYWLHGDHQPFIGEYTERVYDTGTCGAWSFTGNQTHQGYESDVIGPAICFEALTEKYPTLKAAYEHLMIVWRMCKTEEQA